MTQGERVKEIRKSLEMTMEQFGSRLGVTKVAISRIEKGFIGSFAKRSFSVEYCCPRWYNIKNPYGKIRETN